MNCASDGCRNKATHHGICRACYHRTERYRSKNRARQKTAEYRSAKKLREKKPTARKLKRLAESLRGYGLNRTAFLAMAQSQGHVCLICALPEQVYPRLSVDHDHVTGAVRGLLCSRCNRAMGHFGDSPILMERAAAYLREHKKQCDGAQHDS